MKAAELTNIREIHIVERSMPKIGKSGDVRIRVKAIGVCGSDVHYYTTGRIGDQVVQFPWITGHETAGIIDEIGKDVKGFKKGDRIALDPSIPCGTCDQCGKGRFHTCRNQRFLGCPGQIEGSLAEYIVMPAGTCYRIPDTLTYEDAVLSEPLSIGMYAVSLSGIRKGMSAAVFGTGPIGLSILLALKAEGIGPVYCIEPLEYRRKIARKEGAAWTGSPEDADAVLEAIQRGDTGPQADYVFECCGQQRALDQGILLCSPGGNIMIVGIPEFDDYRFAAHTARRQELSIRSVRRQNNFVQPAIDAIAAKTIQPRFMVTHHFSLEEAGFAFQLLEGYRDGVIKAIIHM